MSPVVACRSAFACFLLESCPSAPAIRPLGRELAHTSHTCGAELSSRACVRVSLTRLCQELLHEPWVLPHRPAAAPASVRPLGDLGELGVRESRIFILYCWLESNTAWFCCSSCSSFGQWGLFQLPPVCPWRGGSFGGAFLLSATGCSRHTYVCHPGPQPALPLACAFQEGFSSPKAPPPHYVRWEGHGTLVSGNALSLVDKFLIVSLLRSRRLYKECPGAFRHGNSSSLPEGATRALIPTFHCDNLVCFLEMAAGESWLAGAADTGAPHSHTGPHAASSNLLKLPLRVPTSFWGWGPDSSWQLLLGVRWSQL